MTRSIIIFSVLLCSSVYYFDIKGDYPLTYINLYLGTILLIYGIIRWLSDYKKKYKHKPRPLIALQKVITEHENVSNKYIGIMGFIISNFQIFVIVLFCFVHITMTISSVVLKNTESFRVATEYLKNDDEIVNYIGEFNYYGFLVSRNSKQAGEMKIRFNYSGDKNTADVRVYLKKNENTLQVDSLYFDGVY